MKSVITVILFCSISMLTNAHPGVGIVKDKKGNIYYTDLKQVWKITWGHYVWSLKSDGRLVKIIEPKEGFLENYSFVRDDAGNMYWVERWKVSRIKKKSPDGNITTLAEGSWGDIRWMFATPKGKVYFTSRQNLYKTDTRGKVTTVASNIVPASAASAHNLYGIWTDNAENVYVAIMGPKTIKKITPAGQISVMMQGSGSWTPTGGVFDNTGNLWVLENSEINEVRVRKIEKK